MKAVILAGGSGERFWPLSTRDTPKQFLALFGPSTLIEQTYGRMRQRFHPDDIIVITSKDHIERTANVLKDIPRENIIGEPVQRNTAPACALAAMLSDPGEVNLVVPADHHIPRPDDFWRSFDIAMGDLVSRGGLFTFGIQPTRPETGYGYIEAGERISEGVWAVERFIEKPDLERADIFSRSGGHYWNSGMFIWKAGEFLSELKRYAEDVHGPISGIDPRSPEQLEKVYPNLPKISVDHAVMERSDRIKMVEGDFKWSDVGNWLSLKEMEGSFSQKSGVVEIDSDNVFIRSTGKRPIGVVGLNDVIIIDTEHGLLICSDRNVQKVREVYRAIK
ncbi:MAG: mannose-1-phosphate guanylyltransferase [Thermoplasmatota archaeon]